MGFLDFLMAGPRVEHAKTAIVGKYVFDSIEDQSLKEQIVAQAIKILHDNSPFRVTIEKSIKRFQEMNDRVRYIFIAMAMAELGIDHHLSGFYASFPRNFFSVELYSENIWNTARKILSKKYGISVDI